MKRVIALLLSLLLLFSFVGCSGSEDDDPSEQEIQLELTDNYLVKDKKSDYKIVYPENATDNVLFAVSELQNFFRQATGVQLQSVKDTSVTYSADAKLISVGPTCIMKDAGITYDYGYYKERGYMLTTKNTNLFLYGGIYAAPSAVYEFLDHQFGFEVYAYDEVYLGTTEDDVLMYDYDLKIRPSFAAANISAWQNGKINYEVAWRMEMQWEYEAFLPKGGMGIYHNFLGVFPEDKYGEQYPHWFSNGQLNLSYSEKDVDIMTDILVDTWINDYVLKSYELGGSQQEIALTFTAMDVGRWSNAESSMKLYEQYGCYAAEYIKFVNIAARKMNAWMEENLPDRTIRYLIFAYQSTTEPPVKQGANGEWLPIDDTVVLEKNVKLWYAPLRANFYNTMYEEINVAYNVILEKWSALEPEPWFWLYCENFEANLLPLDFMNCVPTNMQWAYEHGGEAMMYTADAYNVSIPDWGHFMQYIVSKLGKDVYLDVEKLTDDFFANYFKDASTAMRKFYDEYRAHFAYLRSKGLTFKYMEEAQIGAKENWPYAMLSGWMKHIEEAYKAIEHLKETDLILYTKLENRITIESITVRYLLLDLYSARLNNSAVYAQELLNDALRVGVTNWNKTSLTDFMQKYM